MKTKTFIIVCLLLGFGLTQLSAQSYVNGTGAISFSHEWSDYSVPVYTPDGEQVDMLLGPVSMHIIDFYKNWEWIWRKIQYSGEIVSVGFLDSSGEMVGGTGEVFSIKDIWKFDALSAIGPGHFNARGNHGSHYLINYIWDDTTLSFIFVSAIWPGYKE
ncbi:MAG: hypothetical protein RB288_08955 [Bacteroidales bacterium]|jgi:hypothetical protein|nr:hypothetical protein [Bacteroidales bacterium]